MFIIHTIIFNRVRDHHNFGQQKLALQENYHATCISVYKKNVI